MQTTYVKMKVSGWGLLAMATQLFLFFMMGVNAMALVIVLGMSASIGKMVMISVPVMVAAGIFLGMCDRKDQQAIQ